MRRKHTSMLLALALVAVLPIATARASRPLTLGFADNTFAEPPAMSSPWFERAVYSGASVVRESFGWSSIEPSRPTHPDDPADPAYQWQGLDVAVREAAAFGLQPIIVITGAPPWAEGPNRPRSAPQGTWLPNATAFGQFAVALGRRYAGNYPDPLHLGAVLPRVRFWQPWNEPNLPIYMTPQWTRVRGGFTPASPGIYRALLNAFYSGVKQGDPGSLVITGGTAPFGDPFPGGQRMPPAEFVRELLCLHGRQLALEACPAPAHFDVLAHHPYSIGNPFTPALDPDDVSIPDLYKLYRILDRAERTGRALPHGNKALWVTEVSYDSNPPDPRAVPMHTFSRWVAETLFELWRERVPVITWYLIRDSPPIPNYASTSQSGMYFLGGTSKPADTAFRFPLVVKAAGRLRQIIWTRVPAGGLLTVQRRRSHGSWITAFTAAVTAHQVIARSVAGSASGTDWRALVGDQSSLVWGP